MLDKPKIFFQLTNQTTKLFSDTATNFTKQKNFNVALSSISNQKKVAENQSSWSFHDWYSNFKWIAVHNSLSKFTLINNLKSISYQEMY